MRDSRPFASRYEYVRRARDRWHARVWVGELNTHVSLGIYDEELLANHAARMYLRRGEIPPRVLPRYVRRTPGGFVGRVRGRRIPPPGDAPFATAAEAHAAVIVWLLHGDYRDQARAAELLTPLNEGLAAFVVARRPNRGEWPAELAAAVPAELVEDCRRRAERSGGYAEAVRRWAA